MTPSCRSESEMALSPNTDGAYLILKLYEVEKMLVLIFFDNATHMGCWWGKDTEICELPLKL